MLVNTVTRLLCFCVLLRFQVWEEWHSGTTALAPLARYYVERGRELQPLFGDKKHVHFYQVKKLFYQTRYHVLCAIAEEAGLTPDTLLGSEDLGEWKRQVCEAVDRVQLAMTTSERSLRQFNNWLRARREVGGKYGVANSAFLLTSPAERSRTP